MMERIKKYWKRHVIMRYALLLTSVTFLLVFFTQYILVQGYTQQMKRSMLESEEKSMNNMAINLEAQMKPYLNILYDAATDAKLLVYVENMNHEQRLSSQNRMLVQDFLKKKVMYNNNVLMFMVLGKSGERITYNKMDWQGQSQQKKNLEYEEAMELYQMVKKTGELQVFHGDNQGSIVYVGVPLVGNWMAKGDIFSIVVAALDLNFLHEFFAENSGIHVENYLVDQNGNILMCKQLSKKGKIFQKAESDSGQILLEKQVNKLGWTLYAQINGKEFLQESFSITGKVSMIYILLIVFLMIFTIFMFRYIMEPLKMVVMTMKDVGRGNFGIRMEVKGEDEIWQVVQKFNCMLDKLERYYELNHQQYESMLEIQKRKQEAEFEVLESYINSHFIFNTLNVINYQVMENGNQKASMMIKRLSNIMRYAFNSRLQYIYLYQEMLWVEQYLFLQSECDGHRLQFEVLVDEKIGGCLFRKMILQPFVENSILHGLKGRKDGKIFVKARGTEDRMVEILIEDNGCGISRKDLEKIKMRIREPSTAENGIGISNVVTRLKYYFGDRMGFEIISQEGKGTRIEIKIPYKEM